MASMLRHSAGAAGGMEGLEEAVLRVAARQGLVFLVSDFHWPLDRLNGVLDVLVHAYVVPVIVWDRARFSRAHNALAVLRDSESVFAARLDARRYAQTGPRGGSAASNARSAVLVARDPSVFMTACSMAR